MAEPPRGPLRPQLPRGVHALEGLAATLPNQDLDAAFASLGTPDVIALGETVHTSEGYAEARVRVLRYLIEKQGLRAVGFESPWREAEKTRAYVERCEGTLAEARAGLSFRAWMSRATSEFLEWLCHRNAKHTEDQVTVFGFDIQDPARDGSYVRSFFAKAAPAATAKARALDQCVGARFETMQEAIEDPIDGALLKIETPIPATRHEACLRAAAAVRTYVDAHEAALVAATSREQVELVRFAARALVANDEEYFYFTSDPRKSYEARDQGMADGATLMRTLRARGKRVALVAHNDHIMRARDEVTSEDHGWKSMGSWLRERWGPSYAPIGLFARNVAINWDGSGVQQLPPRDGANDVERPLHDIGKPYLFVDLGHDAVYVPGKKYSLSDVTSGVPARHFRALVFLESSEAFRDPIDGPM